MATCPSIQLPSLLFVCVLFLLFVDVLSGEPKQKSFFPRGVLDEILNLIESVSEGFPSYSSLMTFFIILQQNYYCTNILENHL